MPPNYMIRNLTQLEIFPAHNQLQVQGAHKLLLPADVGWSKHLNQWDRELHWHKQAEWVHAEWMGFEI